MKIEVGKTYQLLNEEVTVQSIDDFQCVVEDGGGRVVRIDCNELRDVWRPPPPPKSNTGCAWCGGEVGEETYSWREKEIVCESCGKAAIRVSWLGNKDSLSAADFPTLELAIAEARKRAEFDCRNAVGVWGGNRLLRAFACGYELRDVISIYREGHWGQ